MKNTLLLLIAVIITIVGFIPLVIVQSLVRSKVTMSRYHYNVAVHIDYLWASLIFGKTADGHTVSALVYKHKIMWAIKAINWIFNDPLHCNYAYNVEFINKAK